jgi:hypothetical protein
VLLAEPRSQESGRYILIFICKCLGWIIFFELAGTYSALYFTGGSGMMYLQPKMFSKYTDFK